MDCENRCKQRKSVRVFISPLPVLCLCVFLERGRWWYGGFDKKDLEVQAVKAQLLRNAPFQTEGYPPPSARAEGGGRQKPIRADAVMEPALHKEDI